MLVHQPTSLRPKLKYVQRSRIINVNGSGFQSFDALCV